MHGLILSTFTAQRTLSPPAVQRRGPTDRLAPPHRLACRKCRYIVSNYLRLTASGPLAPQEDSLYTLTPGHVCILSVAVNVDSFLIERHDGAQWRGRVRGNAPPSGCQNPDKHASDRPDQGRFRRRSRHVPRKAVTFAPTETEWQGAKNFRRSGAPGQPPGRRIRTIPPFAVRLDHEATHTPPRPHPVRGVLPRGRGGQLGPRHSSASMMGASHPFPPSNTIP